MRWEAILFYIVALLVLLLDQLTKYGVRAHIGLHETVSLWGMEFKHIENSGMAGGWFEGYARLFGVAAVVFVILVFYLRNKGGMKGAILDCSFGFLVGGAVGNGMDRLMFGQVTDFIVRSGGVLNIADHAIEAGVVLFIIYVVVNGLKNLRIKKQTKVK